MPAVAATPSASATAPGPTQAGSTCNGAPMAHRAKASTTAAENKASTALTADRPSRYQTRLRPAM